MRILNRPMFKYGGPIKEGVMHGMRSNYAGGQRVGAFNVGSPVKGMFPKDVTGREHHVAPAVGAGIWYGAQGLARLAPTLYRAITASKNLSKASNVAKNISSAAGAGGAGTGGWTGSTALTTIPQVSRSGKVINKIKDWFKADPLYSTVAGGTSALGRGIKWTGKKAWGAGKYATTTPSGLAFFGIPVVYAGGKYILSSTGKELNNNQIKQLTQGPPGGGDPDMYYDKPPVTKSAEELAAEAKAARTAKMEKYMDTMGYDKAKKTALGDALIDASAIVQGDVDEAGSLKKADWGKMINQAIQTTSKRLDKPEQIREAVGLMLTKAEIAKDLEDPEAKELRRAQRRKIEKELKGNTFRENLVVVSEKMPGQAGIDTAVQLTEGKNFRGNIINTTDFNKILKKMKKETGMDDQTVILNYAQAAIDKNPKGYEDGHYTVGNNVITVQDDQVIAVE